MKKKIFNLLIIIITIFTLIQLLIQKEGISLAIIYALRLWVNNLIPALFPFFIITDILINYNITSYIPKIIKDLCKHIFNITDNMLTIFLLSILSGFPSNARNTRALYDKKIIDCDEANHILMFSHFANPVFILTTIGVFFFHNQRMGIVLLTIHYLSNIMLGICLRNSFKHNEIKHYNSFKYQSFGNVFISSIKKAIDTIMIICGIVTVFLILATIIINTFDFNIYEQVIIKGIMEITIGIQALSKLNIGLNYKLIMTSCFLAFGGISVHIQVLSQIVDTKINYHYFLVGRTYQMIIAGVLTFIWCLIIGI